jgi:hypothetical protein
MARGKRSFDDAKLSRLRGGFVTDALTRLGLHWKIDSDFQPTKNAKTKRLYVSVGSCVAELLLTDQKWYGVRSERGGGGYLDLAMHLSSLDIVRAVKVLTAREIWERHP